MSLMIDRSIHRYLISTTSRLTGQYAREGLSIDHAWHQFGSKSFGMKIEEGPASRSAYMISFITEPPEPKAGVVVHNFSPTGEVICDYLSLLFGKRFDPHGFVQSNGHFFIPDLENINVLCNYKFPHNSHKPRADFGISLSVGEFSKIDGLLFDDNIDNNFEETFRTCCKYYALALRSFENDPEVAYLNLITSGEILSNFYLPDSANLISDEVNQAFALIRKNIPAEGEQIVRLFSSQMRQIKKRFKKAVSSLLKADFYIGSDIHDDFGKLTPENIEDAISAAYDLRSKYVHTGRSFAGWISDRGLYEIQLGVPVIDDKDYARIVAKAPTLIGLERIIRHCLLQLLKEYNYVQM